MKSAKFLAAALGAAFLASPASAELDFSRACVTRLDNGLTVIVLEDHSRPVVSTQVIYRSGSRDETAGKTGLAHFLEHLAFRATEHFPNGAATDAIYNAGGEWHGYTWLDQTAYHSTIPRGGLDLLLAIEADRMARVTIDPASIEAERGAVLTEMHGYENDPDSVLYDALAAAALQAHPYRNNTIGYESDVQALTAADALAFYESHYVPANAVLAIVGDVDPQAAMAAVRRHFAALPARTPPPRVAAVEPPQRGERRFVLGGAVERRHFALAYAAPAASSRDLAPFLVLQQLLSGGSGVNFRQNDWGTPATDGSALFGAAEDLATSLIPTVDPYLFVIKASTAANADGDALERELERRIAVLRDRAPDAARLAAARTAVAEQLVFDVETTEDAAHQLAFFEGIGAFDALLELPHRIAAVTPQDVQRVARTYLRPEQRTVGWLAPGPTSGQVPPGQSDRRSAAERPAREARQRQDPAPQLLMLGNGVPVIVQRSGLSPTATVMAVMSEPVADGEQPAELIGIGTIVRSGLARNLPTLIDQVVAAAASAPRLPTRPPSEDPDTRLEQMIASRLPSSPPCSGRRATAIVISGAIDPEAVAPLLEGKLLGPDLHAVCAGGSRIAIPRSGETVSEHIDRPLAQAALGYVVPAPSAASREGLTCQILLYILTHDYGGRLGDRAIRDRGLVYHIASAYRAGPTNDAVTLSMGVDPARIDTMETALRAELARLVSAPPSEAEVEAAKHHLLGRDLSAAQSNEEIAARLARQWVETGGLRSHEALAAQLRGITAADVAAVAPAFARGTILRVDVGPAH